VAYLTVWLILRRGLSLEITSRRAAIGRRRIPTGDARRMEFLKLVGILVPMPAERILRFNKKLRYLFVDDFVGSSGLHDEKDSYRYPIKAYVYTVYIGTSRNLQQTEEVDEQSAELLRCSFIYLDMYLLVYQMTRSITLSTLYVSIAI